MAIFQKLTPKNCPFTLAQKLDISVLSVSDSNFFNHKFANLLTLKANIAPKRRYQQNPKFLSSFQ